MSAAGGAPSCAAHAGRAAEFRCLGCHKLLCEDCAHESHRLHLCRFCGERALPLAPHAPQTVQARRRWKRIEAPYSLGEAALYPLRGQGGLLLLAYVLVMGTLDLFPLGCLGLVGRIFVFLLLPGLLFAIARETARGENEMPDWPDLFEFGERFGEVLAFLGIFIVSALPVALALLAVDCSPLGVFEDWNCRLPFFGGSLLGAFFWVPALGATAAYQTYGVTFRVDLHLRALVAADQGAFLLCASAAFLFAANFFLAAMVVGVPYLVVFAFHLIQAYALFTSAHLSGLLFRRHSRALDPIYEG